MAVTVINDRQLQLSIEPRADGSPWLVETTSLALGLAEAATARGVLTEHHRKVAKTVGRASGSRVRIPPPRL
jgi:hypothetical protein